LLDEDGKLVLISEDILDVMERILRSRVIKEFLIGWRDLLVEDATWEGDKFLQHSNLQLLEGKHSE
jgi:hypothetical protein